MHKNQLLFLSLLLSFNFGQAQKIKQPNIILINCDDLGYGDLTSYGVEGHSTPAIDKLADKGMKFTDFSVTNPLCTPSRAALLTGRYPQRWGYEKGVYFPFHNEGMPISEITLAEILKKKGYNTAAIGKWHLGHLVDYLPTNQGFDYYFGIPYSNDMWQDGNAPLADNVKFLNGFTREQYLSYKERNDKELIKVFRNKVPLIEGEKVIEWPVDQRYITKRFTEKAVSFIETNSRKPFFLYLAHSMPHVPLFTSENFKGKTKRGIYGDVIEELDWSVNEVVKAIEENNLEKNTLVIFTSDNGPWLVKKDKAGSSGTLRGGKMTTFEGGIRVPFIAYWPGIIPAGTICKQHVTSLDIFPTIAKLSEVTIPVSLELDGLDFSQILKGDVDKSLKRKFFMSHYADKSDYSIRLGNWKYRIGCIDDWPKKNMEIEVQLFNLEEDPNELINLANQYPKRVEAMAKRLSRELENIKKK